MQNVFRSRRLFPILRLVQVAEQADPQRNLSHFNGFTVKISDLQFLLIWCILWKAEEMKDMIHQTTVSAPRTVKLKK